ncbi:hypothetical protein [Haloarcula amylolytica]|uniref:Uncharacterized protein n=1 Tax=Haloarcula amylolytica JCM 13557 TaxID=1227452 RepID=M0KQP1_9EURY|nr:hypothetical protein [Haloarcula amylolytica]EMA23273.1 hypothetical protein C442_05896 [Haloarcula amylolytica JCM 13557]
MTIPLNRTSLAVLLVTVLTLLAAGCMGASSGQEGPVELYLTNDGNVSHEFSVSVVEGEIGQNGTVIHRPDEPTSYASPKQGLSTYIFPKKYDTVSGIELPANRTRSIGTYDLAPGEQHQMNVTGFETGDTLVVVDKSNNHVGALITANCDDLGLDFVSVTAGPVRTSASYAC